MHRFIVTDLPAAADVASPASNPRSIPAKPHPTATVSRSAAIDPNDFDTAPILSAALPFDGLRAGGEP